MDFPLAGAVLLLGVSLGNSLLGSNQVKPVAPPCICHCECASTPSSDYGWSWHLILIFVLAAVILVLVALIVSSRILNPAVEIPQKEEVGREFSVDKLH